MKKISLITLFLGVVIISGCSSGNTGQTPTLGPYQLDQSIFFKITFNGRTYTTYGLKHSDAQMTSALSNYTIAKLKTYASSTPTSSIILTILGSNLRSMGIEAGIPLNLVAQIETLGTIGHRSGGIIGSYECIGPEPGIIKILDEGNMFVYPISGNVSSITLNTLEENYVNGTFQFGLIDGNNIIPATGSFRLYKLFF